MTNETDDARDPRVFDYLLASLEDSQGTVRSLDAKLATLAVFAVGPLAALPFFIDKFIGSLHTSMFTVIAVVVIAASLVWLLSLCLIFRGLSAKCKPFEYMNTQGQGKIHGFYVDVGIKDHISLAVALCGGDQSILGKKNPDGSLLYQRISPAQHLQTCPSEFNDLCRSLAFECQKVSVIRDFKSTRANMAIAATFIWIILFCVAFSASPAFVKKPESNASSSAPAASNMDAK